MAVVLHLDRVGTVKVVGERRFDAEQGQDMAVAFTQAELAGDVITQPTVDFGWKLGDHFAGPPPGSLPEPIGNRLIYFATIDSYARILRPSHPAYPALDALPDVLWNIEVILDARYMLDPGIAAPPVEETSEFLVANTAFQLWPYLREAYTSLSSRLDIVPIYLPALVRQPSSKHEPVPS